ncbi:MAG: exopolyphosphatase [Alphaproteobacteria bacterium]|nr:exopolyphosphatase [Alphaproteobacteria bacterium]
MPSRSPPARTAAQGPVGVIDIGSNSIRLVVFSGSGRAPHPIFNEKVLCGLGRGLERTGRLHEEGVESALANLGRFAGLVEAMNVHHLRVVATAAVREAENGPEFARAVRRQAGLKVEILDGAEEARLSALGVLSGMPQADGLMGDLGGGSLELVALRQGKLGRHETLPFGPLRLREVAERSKGELRNHVERRLDELPWLSSAKGRDFYAVGGAWRAIARLHMAHTNYPLRVIHHYTVSRGRAQDFLDLIAGLSRDSLERIGRVPRKRLEVLPVAALVLQQILERARPAQLVFTAMGLREGCLYDAMPQAVRSLDPLIAAADEAAALNPRFVVDGRALHAWLQPLFRKSEPETARLRLTACLLSDMAWNEHPDYRAEIAFLRLLRMPVVAVDHPGRAFVALAVHTRYAGTAEGGPTAPAWQLMSEGGIREAWRLGLALRLAFAISGGAPSILKRVRLERDGDQLRLRVPRSLSTMIGEVVERRFEDLVEACGGKGKIKIGR